MTAPNEADDPAARLREYRDELKKRGDLLGARYVDRCIRVLAQRQSNSRQTAIKQERTTTTAESSVTGS